MQLIWFNVLVIITFISLPPSKVSCSELLPFGNKRFLNKTDESIGSTAQRRAKRYLDFTKGSRMSWRTTVKNNILKVNTLWGYGFGFRANFPFPDKNDRRSPFFKRDVFQSLTDVLDGNGLDGQACILKSFCTAHLDAEGELSGGMLFKLLKYIFTTTLQHPHTATSLAGAALSDLASSSNNNNNADKEIDLISFNGNLLNGNKTEATTQHTSINDTTVSASRPEPALALRRGRRYLDFLEGSRMFFRVSIQTGVVPKPPIWAVGVAYRCNYPIENKRELRPFRRDTYETLGALMDKSGFDGKACILKAFCAAHMDEISDLNSGMLFKLLKYIFKLNDDDKRHFPYLKYENCHQILHSHCPLSFNNISPFTDDV